MPTQCTGEQRVSERVGARSLAVDFDGVKMIPVDCKL